MSAIYYVIDPNGDIYSEDKQSRFTALRGASLDAFIKSEEAKKRYLQVFNNLIQLLPKELIEGVDEDLLMELVGTLLESLSDEEWKQIYDGSVTEELMQILLERLSEMIRERQQGKERGGK